MASWCLGPVLVTDLLELLEDCELLLDFFKQALDEACENFDLLELAAEEAREYFVVLVVWVVKDACEYLDTLGDSFIRLPALFDGGCSVGFVTTGIEVRADL